MAMRIESPPNVTIDCSAFQRTEGFFSSTNRIIPETQPNAYARTRSRRSLSPSVVILFIISSLISADVDVAAPRGGKSGEAGSICVSLFRAYHVYGESCAWLHFSPGHSRFLVPVMLSGSEASHLAY